MITHYTYIHRIHIHNLHIYVHVHSHLFTSSHRQQILMQSHIHMHSYLHISIHRHIPLCAHIHILGIHTLRGIPSSLTYIITCIWVHEYTCAHTVSSLSTDHSNLLHGLRRPFPFPFTQGVLLVPENPPAFPLVCSLPLPQRGPQAQDPESPALLVMAMGLKTQAPQSFWMWRKTRHKKVKVPTLPSVSWEHTLTSQYSAGPGLMNE